MGKLIKFDYVNTHGDFEKLMSHFGLDYEKRGAQLRGLCPFHEDTKPSLSIALEANGDAKENTWHCFGCKQSGSIIDFAALMLGETLRDGAELVAEVSGCGLAPAKTKNAKKPQKGRSGAKGQQAGKSRPQEEKPRESENLEPEGVSEDEAPNPPLRFSLTVDPKHPYVTERISPDLAELFGVGVVDLDSRSMMAGRCCIPIHDETGALVAYAGRYLGDDPKEPKWQLPPKFEKMHVLFNAHRVWGSLHVILVEGFFDAIRLHGLGISAVACMGTTVSEEQVELLFRLGVRRVTVLFDGDEQGWIAANDAAHVLAAKLFTRIGSLPVGCDPDEAPEELLREIARGVP